jgi:phosphoglycerate kinase
LNIGNSLLEEDRIEMAKKILEEAKVSGVRFLLPTDCVVADAFDNGAKTQTVSTNAIPEGWQGLDIGPETVKLFSAEIRKAKTVVWNGPMGVFEMDRFAEGTNAIAKALVEATKAGAITIVGGGDSAAAISKAGLEKGVSHVSTGGGASLEFLEGKILPGVAALNTRN